MKHFQEVLQTLGASNTTIVESTQDWDFWKADYITPVSTVTGYYLYLRHKCPLKEATNENISKWKNISGRSGYELILTPKSQLLQNIENTKHAFSVKIARTCKQLLLDNFLKNVKTKPYSTEEFFIEPVLELEDGTLAQKSIDTLKQWIIGNYPGTKNTSLAVITANGGIGKTTVSRILCDKIQKQDNTLIPILIESEQWKNLIQQNITINNLLDLALSSRFEQASKLINNETALRALIQSGIFFIVFDGFDELCGSSSCYYEPKEIIDELIRLTSSDDDIAQVRILLTSRETYWNSTIDEIPLENIEVFRLKGFDNDQKKSYFRQRLQNSNEQDIAFRLAKQISGGIYEDIQIEDENENRPSGVPFVLSLIAHYVHENPNVDINPYSGDPLEKLLEDICRRENQRQELNIDPSMQMLFFEELFRDHPSDISYEDFKLYLDIILNISEPSIVKRFTSHNFILMSNNGVFSPRYEVLRVYFIARFIAKGLRSIENKSDRYKIAKLLSQNSTGKTQVIDWLVRQLKRFDSTTLESAINHALDIINDKENEIFYKEASSAFFNLIKYFITKKDKAERTYDLSKFLKAKNINNEYIFEKTIFSNSIAAFDFTSSVFDNCKFIDAEFKNCIFSEKTIFKNNIFEGQTSFGNCDGQSKITIDDSNIFSKESEYIFNTILDKNSRSELKKYFAEDAITRALKKFKNIYGFTSIQFKHKNSGFKNGNPYNESVWDILLKNKIIEKHLISNVDDGGLNIVDDKDLKREIASYLDNALVSQRIKKVIDDLVG